jgi:membrane protein
LNIIRERFLSFSVVLGVGFLLLVSLVISAALAALTKWLTPSAMPGGTVLWQAINFLISLGFITVLFALIFKLLPDVQLSWRDVWFGAAATAVLFTAGKFLIGLYLGQTTTSSAYGAAGSLVILLLWVYYSSQIVLLGAELTRVHVRRRGVVIEPTPNAVLLTCDERVRRGLPPSDEPAAAPTAPVRQRRTA